MPLENPANIKPVCKRHLKKPDPRFLKIPKKWFIGKFCKLAFPAPNGRKELMWVNVIKLAKFKFEELCGVLNNDPVLSDFSCGDIIEFSRREIIEVLDGDELSDGPGTTSQRGH